jgi:hypothetical protein
MHNFLVQSVTMKLFTTAALVIQPAVAHGWLEFGRDVDNEEIKWILGLEHEDNQFGRASKGQEKVAEERLVVFKCR